MNQSAFRADIVARAAKMKMREPTFSFGKYSGKTLGWVAENYPSYIVWVYETVDRSRWPEGLKGVYRDVQEAEEIQAVEESEMDFFEDQDRGF